MFDICTILYSFSRDMYAVDQAVPASYSSAMRVFFWVGATLVTVVIVTPYFAAALLPMIVFYWFVQKYFIATSRELRRLSSLMNSPIYSHFSESLEGVSIIRAFGKGESFSTKNQSMIDADHNAYYPSIAANRWLAVRLEFIGNILIFVSAISCAASHPSSSWVGVALSTVMGVTQGLNWFVRQKSQLEQDIVSVERVQQYTVVEQERPFEIADNRPPSAWPQYGRIELRNVYMRYRAGLDPVLKGLTFTVESGHKVGVIGRTGAGKSSIFLALLRLVEIESGSVVIDGIDVSTLGLKDLRSRVSVIPQDPVLFTGTVRFNLDPFEQCSDDELREALSLAHVWKALVVMAEEASLRQAREKEKEKAAKEAADAEDGDGAAPVPAAVASKDSMNEGLLINAGESFMALSEAKRENLRHSEFYEEIDPLDVEVEENGKNFSVGQRQLICMSRAIVRKSKILLLDEATSAVDPATDQMIQKTIREVFDDNTILTIAHRIDTILDYDRILIIDSGNVLEYDSPDRLLSNPNSKFSEIVEESFGVHLNDVLAAKKSTDDAE